MNNTLNRTFLREKLYIPIVMAFIAIWAWVVLIDGYFDTDTWFILATGREIVDNGIPYINPFSLDDGLHFVAQQWLLCVIEYLIYHAFGRVGIFLYVTAVTILAIFVMYKLSVCRVNDSLVRILLSLAFIATLFASIENTRPCLLTYILLFTQMMCCESDKKWAKWMIPLLVMLEANIHSSYLIFHFIYLLPYIVPSITKYIQNNANPKKFLPVFAVSLGTMFINPYGKEAVLYLYYSYNGQLTDIPIRELQSLLDFKCSYFYMVLALVIAVTFLTIKAVEKERKLLSSDVYMFVGTFLMVLVGNQIKLFTLMGVGSLLLLSFLLADINLSKFLEKEKLLPVVWALLLGCFVVFTCITVPLVAHDTVKDDVSTPVKAVEYLNEHPDGNLYSGFNPGAYLEMESNRKVLIDARPELYFKSINKKEDVIDNFISIYFARSNSEIREIIDRYQFKYFLVYKTEGVVNYLKREGWELVVKGNDYKLFRSPDFTG